MTHRFTLGKKEKLKSRKQIQQLFKEGKSFSIFPFRVIYMEGPGDESCLQAGFSVSTRYFKHATDRNKIKRLMRESYRLQKNDLVHELNKRNRRIAVFFVFTASELPTFKEAFRKIGMALERLESSIAEI